MKEKIIKQAGFSTTFEKDRLEKLIEITIIEALKIMADSRVTNYCVGTTYDASIAGCVIEKASAEICRQFEIKKPTDINYETIMGRKV